MRIGQMTKQELGHYLVQWSTLKQSDFEVFNVKVDRIEENQKKGKAAHQQFQLEIR